MKGSVASAAAAAKRRWRCLAATGAGLLFFSLVVPLAVLLGLHARFPSGFSGDENSAPMYEDSVSGGWEPNPSEDSSDARIDGLVKQLSPAVGKDLTETNTTQLDKDKDRSKSLSQVTTLMINTSVHPGPPTQQSLISEESSSLNIDSFDQKDNFEQGLPGDENGKSCQLEFGTYCLWSVEHREVMKDSIVKSLKDQLFVARSYYPSIAKLRGKEKLSREMKQNIQEHEHMLVDAISDADLPRNYGVKMEKMDQTIAAAKLCAVECHNYEKKLRQLLDMTEDEAHFHMRQSAHLYRLGVQTLPKSLHCLSMRLTVDYFKSSTDMELSVAHKLENPDLKHYVIFSTNILAASITINSTVMNSEESANMVFHLVTSGQNFYTFKNWFVRNSYKEATVSILNFEDFRQKYLDSLEVQQFSPSEEFRITFPNSAQSSRAPMRTEYVSVFGHSLFLLPQVFSNLKKVIVLEDDVIIQRDLSFLWNLNLEGKVIGAVQFCRVRLKQLRAYLSEHPYDVNSCAWMSGLNVVDLEKWRDHDITEIHHGILQKMQHDAVVSWRAAALPASMLAFQDLIHPIDGRWVQLGLGHDYSITHGSIKRAAVLHFNGKMKPWFQLGIPRYRKYWKRYLPQDERFMVDCNVNP